MARLPFCVAKVDIVFQIRKSFGNIFHFFFFRAFISPQFAIFAKCSAKAVALMRNHLMFTDLKRKFTISAENSADAVARICKRLMFTDLK
jgi:hypothetical protein